jgi:hypothetical protein
MDTPRIARSAPSLFERRSNRCRSKMDAMATEHLYLAIRYPLRCTSSRRPFCWRLSRPVPWHGVNVRFGSVGKAHPVQMRLARRPKHPRKYRPPRSARRTRSESVFLNVGWPKSRSDGPARHVVPGITRRVQHCEHAVNPKTTVKPDHAPNYRCSRICTCFVPSTCRMVLFITFIT